MTAADRRRGFTLIELLCVMILLGVVSGILTMLLLETVAVERTQGESYERRLVRKALADQFRADVARAEQAPPQWQQHQAGPQTLILRMKDGEHVLYRWKEEKLERRTFAGANEAVRHLPVGGDGVGVEFVRDGPDAGLVRLRLLTLREGRPLPGQALEIAAALGGDWR
jgi:prepilin-type N-terminal cleavage/methylation domain-containing protein